jgi:hypothetical protein
VSTSVDLDAPSSGPQPQRGSGGRFTVLVVVGVVLVLVVVGVVLVRAFSSSESSAQSDTEVAVTQSSVDGPDLSATAELTSGAVSFRHPQAWSPVRQVLRDDQKAADVALLSTVPIADVCSSSTAESTEQVCRAAIPALDGDGAFVRWTLTDEPAAEGGSSDADTGVGIDAQKVSVRAATGECETAGGARQVEATITNGPTSTTTMQACLAGPHDGAAVKAVTTMLSTYRYAG